MYSIFGTVRYLRILRATLKIIVSSYEIVIVQTSPLLVLKKLTVKLCIVVVRTYISNLASNCKINSGVQFCHLTTPCNNHHACKALQLVYVQHSQGCVHLAKVNHKVVFTLQRVMEGCHKFATNLQGCCCLKIFIKGVLLYT